MICDAGRPTRSKFANSSKEGVANMTLIGTDLFIAPETVTWTHFMDDLIPVTLGNRV